MTGSLGLGFSCAGAEAIEALEHTVHHHVGQRLWGWDANIRIHAEADNRPVVQL